MTENKWTNARISMILFCAKEQLDMWNDVVEKRVGRRDTFVDKLRDEIIEYRTFRGWSPNGFGGEENEK